MRFFSCQKAPWVIVSSFSVLFFLSPAWLSAPSTETKHFEEFVLLAEVTDRSVLIAWGGFEFVVTQRETKQLTLRDANKDPRGVIGESSPPLAKSNAEVQVKDGAGQVAGSCQDAKRNHCWVQGLSPDTEYSYEVFVDGKPWAAGERYDWVSRNGFRGLEQQGKTYTNRFRTFPRQDQPASITFAVLGDFGRGIHKVKNLGSERLCQLEVAQALEKAIDDYGVRLILSTGDTIYDGGSLDDHWYLRYHQPYRYIANRVPVYPTVGNHDDGETEKREDRTCLYDNFYVHERFGAQQALASLAPGLFYRFRFGTDIEFIALDTSRKSWFFSEPYFKHKDHAAFLEAGFAAPTPSAAKWRIPFFHHPPFCAGPTHKNNQGVIDRLVPHFRAAKLRVAFAGHEHNFQRAHHEGIDYFVSGSGGEVRTGRPSKSDFTKAHVASWLAQGHFLIVTVKGPDMEVRVVGPKADGTHGELEPVDLASGSPVTQPIRISLR